MMEELEAIRNAAQLLAVRTGIDDDRLLRAGDIFWSALYSAGEWPEPLQKRVDDLSQRLMAAGSVEATIPRLDESATEEIAAEILALADEFESRLQLPV